jgi:hypothetical protein
VLLAVAALVAGTGVSLLRHPGGVALDTIWAEDGTVFLADAADGAPLAAVGSSYAGYFHLVPRLLGALAANFPAPAAAAVLAISAAVVTSALAILVYLAAAGHLRSPLARLLVSAPVVVAPLAQHEVPNSIANLHWPLLYATFWVLLWTPPGRAGRVVAPTVVALTALSDILVVGLLPLAAIRWLVRRDRYSGLLGGVLLAGTAVQVGGLFTGASSRGLSLDPVQPVSGYLLRAVPATLLGERWLPADALATGRLLAVAASWLLIVAVVLVAARRLTCPGWPLAIAAALHSGVLYVLPVMLSGVAPQRYALAPALLLIVALVSLLQPGGPDPPRRYRNLLVSFAVLCAAVWAVNLQVDTDRADGPTWTGELDTARAECTRLAPATVDVPITPADPAWNATLTCDYLLRR